MIYTGWAWFWMAGCIHWMSRCMTASVSRFLWLTWSHSSGKQTWSRWWNWWQTTKRSEAWSPLGKQWSTQFPVNNLQGQIQSRRWSCNPRLYIFCPEGMGGLKTQNGNTMTCFIKTCSTKGDRLAPPGHPSRSATDVWYSFSS